MFVIYLFGVYVTIYPHPHYPHLAEVAVPKEVTCDSIKTDLMAMEEEGRDGVAQVECNEDGTWFPRQCLGKLDIPHAFLK